MFLSIALESKACHRELSLTYEDEMSLEKSGGQGHWSDDGEGGGAWFAFFTTLPRGTRNKNGQDCHLLMSISECQRVQRGRERERHLRLISALCKARWGTIQKWMRQRARRYDLTNTRKREFRLKIDFFHKLNS